MTTQYLEDIRPAIFQEILDTYPRVALTGAIQSGKTLLLENTTADRQIEHTDEWNGRFGVISAPARLAAAMCLSRRFVVAGMQVAPALEAGLEVDAVVWIDSPRHDSVHYPEGKSPRRRAMVTEYAAHNPDVALFLAKRALHEDEE